MRPSLLVAVGLLLALAAPAASASSSSLGLAAGEATPEQPGIIPVVVDLRVEDILCSEARSFTVTLQATGTGGANATLDATTVAFPVEPRSYFVTPYEARSVANLTVSGMGSVEILASFQPEEGVCFAPGGIPPANATLLLEVGAPATPQEPAPTPTPAETNATPQEPTPATPEAPANPPPEESASPTPERDGSATCAPETSCGYIGDYEGNAPTERSRDAPGLGAIGAIGVLGAVAAARHARRR